MVSKVNFQLIYSNDVMPILYLFFEDEQFDFENTGILMHVATIDMQVALCIVLQYAAGSRRIKSVIARTLYQFIPWAKIVKF